MDALIAHDPKKLPMAARAKNTEDAVRLGFSVIIVEDACRGIGLPTPDGGTTMQAARTRLTELGVRFVHSSAI